MEDATSPVICTINYNERYSNRKGCISIYNLRITVMKINKQLSPEEAKKEIVSRIKQDRILSGITQEKLADMAMVSVRTIKRFEAGEEISLLNFVRILNALDLMEGLDELVPDQELRPSLHMPEYKPRKRVSTKRAPKPDWKWGDEK